MAILKKVHSIKGGYTQINNSVFLDNRIDSTAKTVLFIIMSMKSGWNVNVDVLKRHMTEGRQAIGKALKKLETLGYINRYRIYENGRIKDWVYEVTDYVEDVESVEEIE